MKLLIGADPEVFVHGPLDYISAHDFPCGDKVNPKKTKHGSVQVDGVALEFNIRPAKTKRNFVRNVKNSIGDLETIVDRHDPDCFLSFVPYVLFTKDYLNSLPFQTRILGCNMDWNAYTVAPNPMPDADIPIRTAAGHIHLGWGRCEENRDHLTACADIVKELDVYLGLPSLLWDPDHHRRELYGKAGAFRPKGYGLEYRVLSNAWVVDKDLCGYVFSAAKRCFQNYHKGVRLAPEYGEFARTSINSGRRQWPDKAPKLADFLAVDDL